MRHSLLLRWVFLYIPGNKHPRLLHRTRLLPPFLGFGQSRLETPRLAKLMLNSWLTKTQRVPCIAGLLTDESSSKHPIFRSFSTWKWTPFPS